jgi:hypothetical protein
VKQAQNVRRSRTFMLVNQFAMFLRFSEAACIGARLRPCFNGSFEGMADVERTVSLTFQRW